MANRQTGAKVFVVDDDAAVRDSISLLLELHGLAVETYGSTEEFAAHYERPSRGCVVLDQHLPATSGLDFLMSAAGRRLGLPVVLITGCGDNELRARATEAGAAAYLEKPVAAGVLLEAVDRLVAASRPLLG